MPSKANFQVGLSFSADTSQARKELQSLQKELLSLGVSNSNSVDSNIQKAAYAASELAANLRAATDVDTGRINLSQFQQNLKLSGKGISDYRLALEKLGPEGVKAFNKVADSILRAETPLTKLNGLMGNLWTSFKQTAKYQFTGSIYRGLISGIQSAYNYAQDLNESLNNIRIVTGQSTEQMAKFAEQANKAAQQLSVTTTQYTNGALIYYQQGLSDEEVKARTDVTMKLANASGVSAETASEQLTAIWNNFAKGSENLEYFADVITALGASTASSTSEISEGLEKFAAIGESVGLSYEYAASALATVTATTRQSADVVGTAFKTLFARIQDLELGDTLEDGTTLGKYSQALAAVGVNIKESNGELKAMDQILNEMAGAWSTISKDQQVALAQTVAGTRQYTQLIALMENWSFMQQNLNTAYNSTGTLQEQADIYAESWEAAQKRVKASAESIYNALINDEFFIKLQNGVAGILDFTKDLIDNIGGAKGVLLMISSLVFQLFGPQISSGIDNMIAKVKDLTGVTERQNQAFKESVLLEKEKAIGETERLGYGAGESANISGNAAKDNATALIKLQEDYNKKASFLTDNQKLLYESMIDIVKLRQEEIEKLDQEVLKSKELVELQKKQMPFAKEQLDYSFFAEENQSSIDFFTDQQNKAKENKSVFTDNKQQIREQALLVANDERLSPELRKQANDLAEAAKKPRIVFSEISGLIEKINKGLQETNAQLKNINVNSKDFEKQVKLAGKKTGRATDFAELRGQIKGSGNFSEEALNSLYADAVNPLQNGYAANDKKSNKIKDIDSEIRSLIDRYKELKAAGQDVAGTEELLNKALDEKQQTLLEEAIEENKKLETTRLGRELTEQETKEIEEHTKALFNDSKAQGENAGESQKRADASQRTREELEKNIKIAKANSEIFTSMTSAITSIGFAITSLSSSFETLGNDSATLQQKISAVTSVLMSTTMVIPALTKIWQAHAAKVAAAEGVKQAAISKTLVSLMTTIGIYALVAVGIVAIVAGIKALIDAYNKDAIASEKAAEHAKDLAKAYGQAKESAQKLKDTISNYEQAKKELADLQVGTEEYAEKLKEANEYARELQQLTGKGHYNASTGAIEFNPGELENAIKEANDRMLAAQASALTGQIIANNLANTAANTQIMRTGRNEAEQAGYAAGGNPYDTEGEGAQKYNAAVLEYTKQQQQWLDEAVKAITANGGDVAAAIQEANEKVGAQFEDDFSGVEDYLNNILDNSNKTLQLQKEQLDANLNANNLDYKNLQNDIKDVVNTDLSSQIAELEKSYTSVDALITKYFNTGKNANGENETASSRATYHNRLRAAYANALGDDYFTKNVFGGLKIMTRDENGKETEVFNNLTDAEMEAFLKHQAALKEIGDKVNDTAKSIEQEITDLGEIGINRAKAINLIASGQNGNIDLNSLNSKEIAALYEGSEDEGYHNLIELGKATGQLSVDENGNLTSSLEEINAFLDKMWEVKNSYNDLLKSVGEGLSSGVKSAYEEIIKLDDFSKTQREQIAQTLTQAFTEGGSNGVAAMKEILSQTDDPIGLIAALDQIDWKNTSLSDIQKTLKDAGFDIGVEALNRYKQNLLDIDRQHKIAVEGIDSLITEFKELKEVIDKIDYGTVLSPEDFNNLPDAIQGDFVRTPLGWMFIGDPKDLQQAANQLLDTDEINNYYTQGRLDIANAQKGKNSITGLNDYQAAYLYTTKGADVYDEGINTSFGFNQTAASKANIVDEEQLQNYLADYWSNDETTRKAARDHIAAYIAEINNLINSGEFDVQNQFTTLLLKQFIPVEEFDQEFDKLLETYKEDLQEAGVDIEELRKKTLKANIKLTNDEDFDELDKFKDRVRELYGPLEDYTTELYKAEKAYKALTEQVEEEGLNVEEWEDYTDSLRKNYKELRNNAEAAGLIALQNMRAQKGVDDLKSSYESYFEALKAEEGTFVHDQALRQLRANLEDMYGLTTGTLNDLDAEFWFKEQKTVEAAMKGDEEAAMKLLQDMALASGITIEEWNTLKTQIENTPINGKFDISLTERAKNILKNWGGAVQDSSGNLFNTGPAIPTRATLPSDKSKSSGKSKTLKNLDDEIDRYHYIKKALEDIERELDRVAKVKDRAYGAQHLKYLDQEIQYLQEEVGLQDQYLSQIEGYLGKDRGLIAAYGAQFDAQGNITNYDQMFAANFNKYANADDSTNWENFKKALSKYEETMDLWQEETEKRADLIREILDKRLEGISYKVDIEVALDDREIALLEHQLNRLDDAAYDTADALANIGKQFEQTEESIDSVTNGIVETLKTIPGITQDMIDRYMAGDSSALAGLEIEQGQIDLLEQYSDQLLELSDRLKELHDDALQRVFDAFDAWGEKIDDHVAKFEHLNNVLDNYKEIIGLLGQSSLGISNEFMREMRNQQITNLQGALDTRTQAKDSIAAQLAEARRKLSEAATDAEREDWEKVVDDLEGRLEEATESWQEAWIAALQANKEAFEATMQELVDSFDDYADELKRYDTAQDRYLETYRQAYELSKLTRDIEGSINDQDSIRAKKELQKLEDKINDIKANGRKISEDELGLLQKEYELRLAEIALEDAQNAKSLVRLSRDNEGNWGYVYTADQDKIAEAEQSYEDKLYEYMRQADTMAEKSSRAILTLNKEMAEALAALDVNAEDYEAQVAEITKFYTDQIKYFQEQYGIAATGINDIALESARKLMPEMAAIISSPDSGLQTKWDETANHILEGTESIEDAVQRALDGIDLAYQTSTEAFAQYRERNKETCDLAGVDITQFKDFITGEFITIGDTADDTAGKTKDMVTDMTGAFTSILTEFGTFSSQYSEKAQLINTANEGLATSIITLEETLQNLDDTSLKSLSKLTDHVGQVAQQVKEVAASVGAATDAIDDAIAGWKNLPKDEETTTDPHGQYYGGPNIGLGHRVSALRSLTYMDSGGYTGEWGSSGRIAVLHEKELVLNAQDTENILDAVSLVRSLTAGIGQMSSGLGNIGAGLNNLNLTSGTLDQNVSISASFPNVVDHNEIEEALNNLVNKASQYAFRENRIEPRYV